jgi:hypothetical protein
MVTAIGVDVAVSHHIFRHTFAMTNLRHGAMSGRGLQQLLGHTSLATTQRYLDVLDAEELVGQLAPLPGVAKISPMGEIPGSGEFPTAVRQTPVAEHPCELPTDPDVTVYVCPVCDTLALSVGFEPPGQGR